MREALRVIEEYFRFIVNQEEAAIELKKLRHELAGIEERLGKKQLLENRDAATDCFADRNRPEEMQRGGTDGLLKANFKRAQEAARVIEEYAKVTEGVEASENAKSIRFALYRMEQRYSGN